MTGKETLTPSPELLNPVGIILDDRRLSRATSVAQVFLTENRIGFPASEPSERTIIRIAERANALQDAVAKEAFSGQPSYRKISPEEIENLARFILRQRGAPILAIARHGEHLHTSTPAENKAHFNVRRLQLPWNREDPETDSSIIESFGSAAALLPIAALTGYRLEVEATASERGKQPASALAHLGRPAPLIHRKAWDCPNLRTDTRAGERGMGSDGSLPLTREAMDTNCDITFATFTSSVDHALALAMAKEQKVLTWAYSHTQQTIHAARRAGLDASSKLQPLGFVALSLGNAMIARDGLHVHFAE